MPLERLAKSKTFATMAFAALPTNMTSGPINVLKFRVTDAAVPSVRRT
jgi:hypothetical protein